MTFYVFLSCLTRFLEHCLQCPLVSRHSVALHDTALLAACVTTITFIMHFRF